MGAVLTILKNCFKWKSSDKYWETFPNKNRGDIRMYILSNVITVFYVISLFISIDFLYVIHRCSHIKQERVGEDKGRHGFYDYYGTGNNDGVVAALMETEIGLPCLFTVSWKEAMDGVGLIAARRIRGLPSLIPPRTPPA